MGTRIAFPRKYDSKTISLLSIFLAMVFALEVYPVVGIIDIPIPGITFTIDWTGIPLILLFYFFGPFFSLIGVGVIGIAIGYRKPISAVFKVLAEFYKILGITVVWLVIRNREVSYGRRVLLYTIVASIFCAGGMFLSNIYLLQLLYGMPVDAAIVASTVLIPWNVLQSIINVASGSFLFKIVPDDLKRSFLWDDSMQQGELELDQE